jgi:hypothetical protein
MRVRLYVARRHDGLKQVYGEAPTAVESAKSYSPPQSRGDGAKHGASQSILIRRAAKRRRYSPDDVSGLGRVGANPAPEPVIRYRMRVALRSAYQAALVRNFAAQKV